MVRWRRGGLLAGEGAEVREGLGGAGGGAGCYLLEALGGAGRDVDGHWGAFVVGAGVEEDGCLAGGGRGGEGAAAGMSEGKWVSSGKS